tara:strand:- start:195 stop:572 length:378 start_codon:yes stop_codon:yes gene_type:complete
VFFFFVGVLIFFVVGLRKNPLYDFLGLFFTFFFTALLIDKQIDIICGNSTFDLAQTFVEAEFSQAPTNTPPVEILPEYPIILPDLWLMFGFPGLLCKKLVGGVFNLYGIDLILVAFIYGIFFDIP